MEKYIYGALIAFAVMLVVYLISQFFDWKNNVNRAVRTVNSDLLGNTALHTKLCDTPLMKHHLELQKRVEALEKQASVSTDDAEQDAGTAPETK